MRYNKIIINFCFGLILVVILQILASMPLIHASADGGGGSIVYIGRDNDNIVYAVNPDGTNNKKIYSGTTRIDSSRQLFSVNFDGSQIAIGVYIDGNLYENNIRTINIAKSNATVVNGFGNVGPLIGNNVQFSPDGKKLAFVSGSAVAGCGAATQKLDWTNGVTKTEFGLDFLQDSLGVGSMGLVRYVSWSPDSNKLLFVADFMFKGNSLWYGGIFTINLDGSNARRIWVHEHDAPYDDVSWSPDGQRIALHVRNSLYIMNADGGNVKKMSFTRKGSSLSAKHIKWSPDSSRIVYVIDSEEIWTANSDWTDAKYITKGMLPFWIPIPISR